jgi:hypothetical protein
MIDLSSQNIRYLVLVVFQIQSGFNVCSIHLYNEKKLKQTLFPNELVCWMPKKNTFKCTNSKTTNHIFT